MDKSKNKAPKKNKPKPEPTMVEALYRSPHASFPESLKRHVEKRLQKLTKFFTRILSVSVTHEELRGKHTVSVNLDADGRVLHVSQTHAEQKRAVDELFDRMEHQLNRHKDRMRKNAPRKTREELLSAVHVEETEMADGSAELVEVRRLNLKPMTIDEAILQMELSAQGFLVFSQEESGDTCVIYRRNDGHYAMYEIEP